MDSFQRSGYNYVLVGTCDIQFKVCIEKELRSTISFDHLNDGIIHSQYGARKICFKIKLYTARYSWPNRLQTLLRFLSILL
jgi:hypothetical protein